MGSGASSSSSMELAILGAIASVRQSEGRLACLERLRVRLLHYKGKEYHAPGEGATVKVTKEGKKAVSEAIEYLKQHADGLELPLPFSTTPVLPLSFSAGDHAYDVGGVGKTSHEGSDGSHSQDRISRYCVWRQSCGEVIWYGKLEIDQAAAAGAGGGGGLVPIVGLATQIIDDLIVDDGVESRGHRLAIFDPRFILGGVGISTHKVFGHVVVVNFAHAVWVDGDVNAASLLDEWRNQFEEGVVLDEESVEAAKAHNLTMLETLKQRAERLKAREVQGPMQIAAKDVVSTSTETQWKSLGHCLHCKQPILGGKVIEIPPAKHKQKAAAHAAAAAAANRKWHSDCFLCIACSSQLKGVPFMDVTKDEVEAAVTAGAVSLPPSENVCEDGVVCQACFNLHFAPLCSHCSHRIVEKKIANFQGQQLHVACYEERKKAKDKEASASASKGHKKAGAGAGAGGDHSMAKAKKGVHSIVDDYANLE